MADFALSIGSKVAEYLVEPVLIRPLRPMFCFKTIVDDFHQELEKLSSEQVRVEDAIKVAKGNGCEVYEHVNKWVEDVKSITDDAQKLQIELRDNKSCCFGTGWTYHYRFSKKVCDNTNSIKKLCARAASLKELAYPVDLRQHIGLPFSEDFMFSKSGDSALRAIMETLLNDDVNKIWLYGMGGSGKTTLAKQAVKEAERSRIVERSIIVPFPQMQEKVMISSIQGTIADFLNLKFEQESEQGRASRLHQRLSNREKILIILDDVQKEFDLAKVGIPSFGSSCKVLLITHDLRVCESQQAQGDNVIRLGVLSEDEVWALFKSIAGVGDVLRMHDVTKKVVQSCKGLPKVIINAGRVLRGKEPSQWEETLQQLKGDQLKNISDDLQKEMETLSLRKQRVKNKIETAKNNGQVIEKDVEKWIADVESIVKDAEQLESELNQSIICFSEWDELISKKGPQLITIVKKLYEDGTFDSVAHTARIHQDVGLSFSTDFFQSKSSSSAFHEIMAALKNNDVNMIGLFGMGGIGKTTLAEHVRKETERLKIFDCVVMVNVSQTPKVRKIQGVIADFLNLELKQESEEGRASMLNQRLKTEKVLIILDDVWKLFDLANIGLSMEECKGCKVLLTTRRLQVCTSMGCQTNIPLHLLSEDEAWDFFKKKAYLHDGSEMKDVAKQIVGECKGLHVALATVGSALRNKNTNDWVEALKKLRGARLLDIPEIGDDEKNAYRCLQLSYDYLKRSMSAEAQLLLLLCSLFPEDHEIWVEDLTRYAFGMRLFERVKSVQDARGEVGVIVQCLIDSCLLLSTDMKGIVKIHDVVRDVALRIGGTETPERSVFMVRDGRDLSHLVENERFRNCRAISLMPDSLSELSNYELVCPKLETMLIFCGKGAADLPDTFFNHVKTLKVLDVRGHSFRERYRFSVPRSLQYLADLEMLTLRYCRCFNSFIVKKLKNLKILTINDCKIATRFKGMKKLKLLDLVNRHDSSSPRKLPTNVIGELLNLEELYTYPGYSFGAWVSRDGQRIESCNVSELNSLPNLVRLNTLVGDGRSLPIDFCFPNLECYSIFVGPEREGSQEYDRILSLVGIEEGSQLNTFQKLVSTVEYLKLEDLMLGAGFKNIIPCWLNALVPSASKGFLKNLKELRVKKSQGLEALFECEGQHSNYEPRLQSLHKLRLEELPELKHIWKGSDSSRFVSLCNLAHVEIYRCPKLRSIFSSLVPIAPTLQQLQALIIDECDDLEEVFSADAGPHDDFSGCFQNLRQLCVSKCYNLKAIVSMHTVLRLPKLQQISLMNNGELEHVFGHQMIAEVEQWPSLQELRVKGCPKLSSCFVASIQTQLQAPSAPKQLRIINLCDLQEVEEITQLQQRRDVDDDSLLTFHLETLVLQNLQDLKCISSHAKHSICFSYLTQMEVRNCNKLEQLFPTAVARSLKQLKSLSVVACNELDEIITEETESVSDYHTNMVPITFSKLKRLRLRNLPSLVRFCPANYRLMFPCLTRRHLILKRCPQTITDFFSSQQVTLKEEEKEEEAEEEEEDSG